MEIYKCTCSKYRCQKLKEYVKEVNVYIQNYKVTSNRNICKETNKRDNEKIYKNNKYIQMFIYKKKYKKYKTFKTRT